MASKLSGKRFVPITVGVRSDPRFLRLSHGAVRLWLHSLAFSSEHLTDGLIERSLLAAVWAQPDDPTPYVLELVAAGLLTEDAGGFHLAGWFDWHFSKDEIERRSHFNGQRARDAAMARHGYGEAKVVGAIEHAHEHAQRQDHRMHTDMHMHKSNPDAGDFTTSPQQIVENSEVERALVRIGVSVAQARTAAKGATLCRVESSRRAGEERGLAGVHLIRWVLAALRRDREARRHRA